MALPEAHISVTFGRAPPVWWESDAQNKSDQIDQGERVFCGADTAWPGGSGCSVVSLMRRWISSYYSLTNSLICPCLLASVALWCGIFSGGQDHVCTGVPCVCSWSMILFVLFFFHISFVASDMVWNRTQSVNSPSCILSRSVQIRSLRKTQQLKQQM